MLETDTALFASSICFIVMGLVVLTAAFIASRRYRDDHERSGE